MSEIQAPAGLLAPRNIPYRIVNVKDNLTSRNCEKKSPHELGWRVGRARLCVQYLQTIVSIAIAFYLNAKNVTKFKFRRSLQCRLR